MSAVFRHELRGNFHSLTTYLFGACLLVFICILIRGRGLRLPGVQFEEHVLQTGPPRSKLQQDGIVFGAGEEDIPTQPVQVLCAGVEQDGGAAAVDLQRQVGHGGDGPVALGQVFNFDQGRCLLSWFARPLYTATLNAS